MPFKKYLRFLLSGLAVFFVIDLGIVFYFDNFGLKDSTTFSVSKVIVNSSKPAAKGIKIAAGVSGFEASHDGTYLACSSGGEIYIYSLNSSNQITVHPEDGMQISAFKWIYDRDRLMIAEFSVSGSRYGKLYYMDMADQKVVEIRDNYYNKNITIPLSSASSICQLDMSAETNLTFFKVGSVTGTGKLWESNIMVSTDRLTKVVTNHVGDFACLKRTETLFYEDFYNGKVYRYDTQSAIQIGTLSQFKILGVDQNDNLYLLSIKNQETNAIYYGNPGSGGWKKVILPTATAPENLFLTYPGVLAENLSTGKTMVNLSTKTRISYSGQVIADYDGGFMTEKDHTVYLNSWKP